LEKNAMLEVDGLSAGYGKVQVLWDLSLNVGEGEFVALVGANGAGKTTLLRTVSGVMRPTAGTVTFLDKRIDTMHANDIVNLGLSHIPESRKLFTDMSIKENLEMGAYPRRSWKDRQETMKWVFGLFPRLEERAKQLSRTLSGGEQQMLAMGRGLMSKPKMVIVDEPSNGLAPLVVTEVFEILKSLHKEGMTILLVEQNVRQTLNIADRAYVLENGRLALEGVCSVLKQSDHVRKAYLGF
jgi:branched-chain amino acid transport system ATP-binding protein